MAHAHSSANPVESSVPVPGLILNNAASLDPPPIVIVHDPAAAKRYEASRRRSKGWTGLKSILAIVLCVINYVIALACADYNDNDNNGYIFNIWQIVLMSLGALLFLLSIYYCLKFTCHYGDVRPLPKKTDPVPDQVHQPYEDKAPQTAPFKWDE